MFRHFDVWLAFALSTEETEKLMLEPFLTGDIENFECCGGLNEGEFCVHPRA